MTTTGKTFLASVTLLMAVTQQSGATSITVDNNGIHAAQYTTLQAAVSAAVSGDTIYMHGSLTDYGTVQIFKQLTIIGSGYRIDGTLNNLNTYINAISLYAGSSGTRLMGLSISLINHAGNGDYIDNIYISRCYLGTVQVWGDNWVIENNIISTASRMIYKSYTEANQPCSA